MLRKGRWILFAALAISIGLYPILYFILDRKFGLLSSKNDVLLANIFWNTAFYIHIVTGGLAMLIGWIQFSTRIRNANLTLHKQVGKIYVISALFGGLSGIYIGFYATGGLIPSLGFVGLGIVWFLSTLDAYLKIKNGNITGHEIMMIYSYAACFAAVTLRIWLPLLIILFGDFIVAYSIVAWLCWVPNIVVAYLITRTKLKKVISIRMNP